jgi:hypothetical protein
MSDGDVINFGVVELGVPVSKDVPKANNGAGVRIAALA